MKKLIGWTTESRHEKTCSSRGKRAWSSELTSVKRTVGYRWMEIAEAVIKIILALGFVIAMCALSCSVQKMSLEKVGDDVRNCREEVSQLRKEHGKLLIVTHEATDFCEKIIAFGKEIESASQVMSNFSGRINGSLKNASEAVQEIRSSAKRMSAIRKDIKSWSKMFPPACPVFCPCRWRNP